MRKEFEIFDGILPLICKDISSPWSEKIYAVDASEWGLGCTIADSSQEELKKLGSFCERWRFKDPLFAKAREHVLIDPDSNQPVFGEDGFDDAEDSRFQGVGFKTVDRHWHVCGRHRWKKVSPMPVNEARATPHAAKHTPRSRDNPGRRHAILSDSMTSTCAFSRGRAHSFQLHRVCQQFGALCLATAAQVTVRWVPSEWNPSDGPSRGAWRPSIPEKTLKDGVAPGDSDLWASSLVSDAKQSKSSGEEKAKGSRKTNHEPAYFQHRDRLGARNNAFAKIPEESDSKDSSELAAKRSRSGKDGLAEGVDKPTEPPEVQHPLGGGEALGHSEIKKAEEGGDHRQGPSKASGGDVSGWGSANYMIAAMLYFAPTLKSPSMTMLPQVTERMEKFVPHTEQVANSMGSDCASGDPCFPSERARPCIPHAADVCAVPPAKRSTEVAKKGPDQACDGGVRWVQAMECGAASHKDGKTFKNKGVRRKPPSRPAIPPAYRSSFVCPCESDEKDRADLHPSECGASELLEQVPDRPLTGAPGGDAPLSLQHRRTIS